MSTNDNHVSKKTSESSTLESSIQIAASGVSQILSLLGAVLIAPASVGFTAFGGITTVVLGAIHMDQQKQFIGKVTQELSQIDKTKLNIDILGSDQFKELVIKIVNEAGLTSSPLKQTAFAKGLINTVIEPNGKKLSEKLILIRTLNNMSDEELRILEVMGNAWEENVPVLEKDSLQNSLLNLDMDQIQLACEGLIQQRVLEVVSSDFFGLSILGRKLVAWLSGKQEQEDFENFQKSCVSKLKKEIDSDREAIITEVGIRQSREQARQALQRSGL